VLALTERSKGIGASRLFASSLIFNLEYFGYF
jgi:hypothetical protein